MRLAREAMGVPSPPTLVPASRAAPVVRKAGEEHGSGYVADHLAGGGRGQERVGGHEGLQGFPHGPDAPQVARKYKEAHKSGQKAVVHLFEQVPAEDQQEGCHDNQ